MIVRSGVVIHSLSGFQIICVFVGVSVVLFDSGSLRARVRHQLSSLVEKLETKIGVLAYHCESGSGLLL